RDQDVDLVVVATKPLSTHCPAARQALEAHKHVLLEKPMCLTSAECDDLIALASRQRRVLTVHHNRRLDLDFMATVEYIRRGKVGEPRLIEDRVCCGAYGGGDCVDWGVHLVDQALCLGRGALQEVTAMFCNPAGGSADAGFVEATLRFSELPLVRISMMPRPPEFLLNGTPPAVRFYVAGTTGAFVQRTIEDPRDLMNATVNFDKQRPDYEVPPYLSVTRKGYYDYLYESLADGRPLLVKPEEARNAIRTIELMEASARAGRTVAATDMLTR
ncbi:MAG: Gfo/Idh/MocA family oxidoreductase, partial [Kiritimatiellae bacterium]|nr:Gfo/Idh/MocA family oxidoreductase [Kiritimatiellia bacterium]